MMKETRKTIYDTLLGLPLFQGLGHSSIMDVVGHTKIHFTHHAPGEQIVSAYSPCQSIIFLIKGGLKAVTYSDNRSYHVEEIEHAPFVIEPERLFGFSQNYSSSYMATSNVDLMHISKNEVITLAANYYVFRINLLNILTTQNQRLLRRPWRTIPRNRREKIVRFFVDHSSHPAGHKLFHIGMQQLATHIGESRLNVSRELHAMTSEGLVLLARGIIEVPALEQLLLSQH